MAGNGQSSQVHFRPLNGVNPPIKQRQGAARITNSTSHGSRHYVMIPTIPISSGGLDRPEFRLQGGKWFCLAFPRPAFRSRKDHNRCLFFSVHLEHCQGALFFFFFLALRQPRDTETMSTSRFAVVAIQHIPELDLRIRLPPFLGSAV